MNVARIAADLGRGIAEAEGRDFAFMWELADELHVSEEDLVEGFNGLVALGELSDADGDWTKITYGADEDAKDPEEEEEGEEEEAEEIMAPKMSKKCFECQNLIACGMKNLAKAFSELRGK